LQARASEIVDSLEAAKITFLNLVQRMIGTGANDGRDSRSTGSRAAP
jgi:biopolymer transport protein ExbB